MKQKNTIVKLGLFLAITSVTIFANNISNETIPTKHNKDLTISQLANIQPGLGSIMMEFGHRFYIAYYAGKARNWELAKYEIHELLEAQEVAEITRPKYTKELKEFEYGVVKKLQEAIEKKTGNFLKLTMQTPLTSVTVAIEIQDTHTYNTPYQKKHLNF